MVLARVLLFLLSGIAVAGPASAGSDREPKGVVELFTSQGCASCPPADVVLGSLIRQGDVIALSYHIDYWNYLGWTDPMSSRENTERQYGYARTLGRGNVYTPQAVINGRDHMKGTSLFEINAKIDGMKQAGHGLIVAVRAVRQGDELKIEIGPGQGKARVVVAYFGKQRTVMLDAGENSGKQLTSWHNVTDVQTVGMWDGKAMKITLPANMIGDGKRDGCAVLLQKSGPGGEPAAIIGAGMLETPEIP